MNSAFGPFTSCPKLRRWALLVATLLVGALTVDAAPLSESAVSQIQALIAEKNSRSPAEQKMDSQLIYGLKQSLNQPVAAGVPTLRLNLKREADGRVWVDLNATITPQLLNDIKAGGGTVLNSFPQFNAARILIPLSLAETLAARSDVRFVQAAVPSFTRTGSVDSEGDTTHAAVTARPSFRVAGAGVNVGVLSDSVDYLSQAQSTGDLPSDLVVLPGQSGVPSTGEGTAMLEIVYDLAPGSKLFFATADGGPAQFAQNILNLQAAGCDIIVDDVGYFNESPFQDGIIAQAVNSVTARGALYFSAAGNEGNELSGTSGTWEGDFVDGGAVTTPVDGKGGNFHMFGTNNFDKATQMGMAVILLWSDPLGHSTNDYDLYVLDTNGTAVVSSSTTIQNGTQDPFEIVPPANPGERIVVVKASGDPRFLHIDTIRGQLQDNTDGNITGHPCAVNAYAVSAVDVHTAYPNPFTGGAANPVEFFSTDGPRRVFYNVDGSAITPGNYSASGGTVRNKPDITAANGVATTLPPFSGLNPFYGTSAAAPHAAAIAALVKSYNPTLSPGQIRGILTGTALDIEAPGYDFNSGFGIVMADRALAAAPLPAPLPDLVIATNYISGGNGDGIIEFNECNDFDLVLTNMGRANATGVRVSISTFTPGVIIAQPNSQFPDILTNTAATNFNSFKISTAPDFNCGEPIRLLVQVKSDQLTTTIPLTVPTGIQGIPLRFDSYSSVPIPDVGSTSSTIVVSNVPNSLQKVTVSMYITHPSDSDLVLRLVSPDGTTNLLARNVGFGQNYGLGCSPDNLRTTFDDDASTFIGSGSPPFQGSFIPQSPLTVFSGKAGTSVNGPWQLVISDTVLGNVGALQCWSLTMIPTLCTNGGGECPGSDLAIGMAASPEPDIVGQNLQYTLSVTNFGPSTAGNVAVSQVLPSSVVFVSATSSQGSVAQAGGVVSANLGPMAAGATATVTVLVMPTTVGTISSTAKVSSEQPDFNLANNSASIFSTVNPPTADLGVALMASPSSLFLNGHLTYSLLVTNYGPSSATGVIVTNVLPPGVVLLGATVSQGNVSISGNTVVCVLGAVANGANATATFNAVAVSTGSFAATSTVLGNQTDPNLANNTATAVIVVGPTADLALGMTASPNPAILSSNLMFVTSVTNNGPSPASSVVVNETLPLGVSIVSNLTSQGSLSVNGGSMIWSVGNLPLGARATLTTIVSTFKLGLLTATASATATEPDINTANNSASAAAAVALPFVSIAPAGASLTLESFSPPDGAIDVGETVTLQLRLQNSGNVPNTNLVATLLPTGGVTPGPGSVQTYGILNPIGVPGGVSVSRPFTFTANPTTTGNVVATLQLQDGPNTLPPVSFTFPFPTASSFSNTNLVLIPDPARMTTPGSGPAYPYPSTNFVSGITNYVGHLTVTLNGFTHTYPHDVSALLVSPTSAYTLLFSHVADVSSLASPTTLTLDDSAPAPLPASGSIGSGSWQPAAYSPAPVFSNPAPAGPYTASLASFNGLNPNGTWSLYLLDDGTGDTGSIAGGWTLNFINVTPVNQVLDLGLSVTANPSPVLVGSNITYTFTVTNAGPSTASGVTFTNLLPSGLTLLSATPSQGNCVVYGNLVVGNLAGMGPGTTATITIVAQPGLGATGVITNSGYVTSYETDLHAANNLASAVTTVSLPVADLALDMTATPASVLVTSNVTAVLAVTNSGPGTALGVVLTNALPAGASYVSASASQGSVSLNGSAVVANLGSLAAGSLASVTIRFAPQITGSLTNTAKVSTASSDPVLANNAASAVVSVSGLTPNVIGAGATLLNANVASDGGLSPGQTVTIAFALQNTGVLDTANLVATLQASGGVTAPSAPQTYGRLVAGGPAVSQLFTFTVSPSASGAVVATLQLQDGAANLGSVPFTFGLPGSTVLASTNAIVIPDHGPGSPYPASITISGATGFVSKATVTLLGLSHGFATDVNVLLVSPDNRNVLLMSHAGGPFGLTNLNLTFDDAASVALPATTAIVSGTYLPSHYGGIPPFVSPAPYAPFGSTLAALNGANPNGAWKLYVLDDSPGDGGVLAGGWSLNLTLVVPVNPVADLAVGVSGYPASLSSGSLLTYTVTVTNLGPESDSDVVVTDTVPAGVLVLSNSISQGSVAVAGNTLTGNFGPLSSGSVASLVVSAIPQVGGNLVNTASASGASVDLNSGNNTASLSTAVGISVPALLTGNLLNEQFVLTISAQPGIAYDVEASQDLVSWSSLGVYTAPFNGIFQVSDPGVPGNQARFYRTVRLTP